MNLFMICRNGIVLCDCFVVNCNISNFSALFVRLVALHQFNRYILDSLWLKYGFYSSVAGMKCTVNSYFAFVVLCDT